jgi:hypothetical protein
LVLVDLVVGPLVLELKARQLHKREGLLEQLLQLLVLLAAKVVEALPRQPVAMQNLVAVGVVVIQPLRLTLRAELLFMVVPVVVKVVAQLRLH